MNVLANPDPARRLRELAVVFLRLGVLAFGGPAAHIAMMDDEIVERRRWLSRERFLDLLGAANLIPGPNSTELAIHIGYQRAGWPGLLVAGSCFILPAAAIVGGLAWAYDRYQALPAVAALFHGVVPVIVAVVLQALGRLGRAALRDVGRGVAAIGAVVLTLLGVHELLVLGLAGAGVLLYSRAARGERALPAAVPFLLTSPGGAAPADSGGLPVASSGTGLLALAAAAVPVTLDRLFLFFVKVGSVLYGSGYVLLAFLRADLVERWGWLTERQLLDAIAVGQVTPGPVFTTATFVGYVLAGPAGAAVATAGIFLPAFVFVALTRPWIGRLRNSAAAGAFLDGVNAGSLALMAVVTLQLARAAVVDALTAGLLAVSVIVLWTRRVNPTWLILGGAMVGLLAMP
ncbi:MAG TPA: chromate efflux transporter [Bacillota bacterium]